MNVCKGQKKIFNYRISDNVFSLHITYTSKSEDKLAQKAEEAKKLLDAYYLPESEEHLLNLLTRNVTNMLERAGDVKAADVCPYRVLVYIHGEFDSASEKYVHSLLSDLEALFGIEPESY